MRINNEQVLSELRAAIDNKTPFSAIRLGDGEGLVMGFPTHVSPAKLGQIWKVWFGHTQFNEIQINFIKDELKKACQAADIIGLPMETPDFDSNFGRVEAIFEAEGYRGEHTKLANSGFHLGLHASNGFATLFNGITSIGVIGSRDIAERLRQDFDIVTTFWAEVPPEMQYSQMTNAERMEQILLTPHLWDKFYEVWNFGIPYTLSLGPGSIVLVGAGILGKIYCQRVKELGGIAIDVGSMMDLWAGLKTRRTPHFDGLVDLT